MQSHKIAIINYGMGNITSLANAIRHLGHEPQLIGKPEDVTGYDTLLLPGVGAFPNAMQRLHESGMYEAIREAAFSGKKIIGICLGMQLLFSQSSEFGITKGLDLIAGEVKPFSTQINLKVPHMGWNDIQAKDTTFSELEGDYYFVHSFYAQPKNPEHVLFESQYGIPFCAAVRRNDNIFGFQFHPEKSQQLGLNLLQAILC
ncbi:MAG: imidazole glycerol phosphate synthase subunit HisH [Bacteroidota bacterium]